MFQTFREKRAPHFAKKLPSGINPKQMDWGEGGNPAVITFSDGEQSFGSCIRCIDSPCIEYSISELELEVFKDFPADRNPGVCPTSAITWEQGNESPTIHVETCIKCGLCVDRCPVGAIYIKDNGAHVNDRPNKHFIVQKEQADFINTKSTTRLFHTVVKSGIFLKETDALLREFRAKFDVVAQQQNMQFPNHLARNLLIASGIGAVMRRRGDVYLRMDLLLGPPGVQQGTGEVELGSGVLDSPRNILDNIAVLVARYELNKDNVVPLIVCLDLPNLRSEYWQFIKDVKDVLNVRINSITIGALVVTVWNRAKIKISAGDDLYIDIKSPSLRPKIETLLGRKLNISGNGYPGFLESGK